jgi:hypothetical protein
MLTDSIGSIAPAVKWALNGLTDNSPATEIRAHMGAVGIHYCEFPARGSESNQSAPQDLFRNWIFLYICTSAEQVPAGRIIGELIG